MESVVLDFVQSFSNKALFQRNILCAGYIIIITLFFKNLSDIFNIKYFESLNSPVLKGTLKKKQLVLSTILPFNPQIFQIMGIQTQFYLTLKQFHGMIGVGG